MPIILDTTPDYHTEAARVGLQYELTTTRIATGDVIATVRYSDDEFHALWCEMQDVADYEDAAAYDAGYDMGYEDGKEAA